MENYAPDYARWRNYFNKLNWITIGIVCLVEVAMFFIMAKNGMLEQTAAVYFKDYLLIPIIWNLLAASGGALCIKYMQNEGYRNGAPVIAFTLICGNIAHIHCFFIITMMIFCIPIFVTAFFGSKKLLRVVSVLSALMLAGIFVESALIKHKSWAGSNYVSTLVITVVMLIASYKIADTLIGILNDKNEQLIQMALEAKRSEAEAIRANEVKSEFLSVVSHEIRTPLNAIVGMSGMMLREEIPEDHRKYLNNIKTSGDSLVMIVNDLLDQSKIEAGKMDIVSAPYDIRTTLDDIRMVIENRIGEKPIELVYDVDEELPSILVGDGLRIRQILINLMNNAVKFTEKGKITASVQVKAQEGEQLQIRFGVKDSGQGIKQEDLDRLFDAFAQVDVEKNHQKEGTGLGLTISSDFVSMMGGRLEVTSEYGHGSEFYFSILQGVAEQQSAEEETIEEFKAPNAKILVVDDTPVNLMIFESLLGLTDIKPDTAKSGKKASQMIQNKHYDLVFMDYMMPEMDGVETIKNIRGLEAVANEVGNEDAAYYRDLKIVALTADVTDETKQLFIKAGACEVVEKPVPEKRMREILLDWLPEELIVR